MEIEWVDSPPPDGRGGSTWQHEFANELRSNPLRWAVWPKVYEKPSSYSPIKNALATGSYKMPQAFQGHKWEAVVRKLPDGQTKMYVRCVGPQ